MFAKTLFLALLFAAIACAAEVTSVSRMVAPNVKARRECKRLKALVCILSPVSGSSISGKILFTPAFKVIDGTPQCRVRIRAKVAGLTGRRHGFHIHQYGDISSLDGSSTGGHFGSPDGSATVHGYPGDAARHWGDFGNLRGRGGKAYYNRVDRVISLAGIVGRGITIHEGMDMGSDEQPSGAAGPRKAVCVIGYANPSSLAI